MRLDGREISGSLPLGNWVAARSVSALTYKRKRSQFLLMVNGDVVKIVFVRFRES